MTHASILEELAEAGAVFTDSHFVYTSGKHGPAYVNMRGKAHDAKFMASLGQQLADAVAGYDFDLVIGPDTGPQPSPGSWTLHKVEDRDLVRHGNDPRRCQVR